MSVSPSPPAPGGLATEQTPSLSLPLRYFALGIGGWLAAMVLAVVMGPELAQGGTWSPRLLALVHLLALGCFAPIVMGASYQLVPVVLLTRIRREGIGKLAFWPYVAGVGALVWGFWHWAPVALGAGGALVATGLAIFLVHLVASLVRGAAWGQVGSFFVVSLSALAAAAALGVGRLATLIAPAWALPVPGTVIAHATLAAVGCFSLLIFGVSYRLVPMFAVAPEADRAGTFVLVIGGFSVVAIAAGDLVGVPLIGAVGSLTLAFAIVLWIGDAIAIFGARTRRRLDVGLSYVATGIGWLAVTATLGLVAAGGFVPVIIGPVRGTVAFALVGLVGWIGFTMVGHLYKILPFLIWFHRYSALLGKRPVPLIGGLYDDRLARAGYIASQLGLALLLAATLFGWSTLASLGAGLLVLGAVATAVMLAQCLTR